MRKEGGVGVSGKVMRLEVDRMIILYAPGSVEGILG